VTSLAELCDLIVDCEHKTAPTVSSGFPLIRTPDIGFGRLNIGGAQRVDESTYSAWTQRAVPRPGDLILAREAPVGNVGPVLPGVQPVLGQRTVLIRPRADALDPMYLNYLLCGPRLRGWMHSVSSGATLPHLNMADIRSMELPPLPPLSDQRKIAAILSAYDDLIENNKRRIKILEEMAQRIYREWFVEFRYPGHEGVPVVGSVLGPIPDGWGVGTLGSLVEVNANTIRKIDAGEVIRYIDIASVARGAVQQPRRMLLGEAPGRARRRVASGDVLWSTVRPNLRAHALVLSPDDDIVASTGFVVLTPRRASFAYIYALTTTDEFVEYLSGRATGSAYPAVTPPVFEGAPTILPPPDILDSFAFAAEPLMRRASCASTANELLRTSRDILLPRLIAGEIDVTDLDIDVLDLAA
jgi:type I restriction enzyme S subunit